MIIKILLGMAVLFQVSWAQTEEVPPTEESAAEEFSLPPVIEKKTAATTTHDVKAHVNDENIDYQDILKKITLEEVPNKAYRHHYIGSEGYRPNTIAISTGGRTPGYGAFVDYSFNRLGIGFSASFRPIQIKQTVSTNDVEIATNNTKHEVYTNIWAHYNWIPYRVSPYVLVGLESGFNTLRKFDVMAGVGVESRIGKSFTLFLEYIRHETARKGFAGLALGLAF